MPVVGSTIGNLCFVCEIVCEIWTDRWACCSGPIEQVEFMATVRLKQKIALTLHLVICDYYETSHPSTELSLFVLTIYIG